MKKVFLAVLAIAAMMVSCQKEGLVDNQKETPEVEVNEPQPVILGSNLFKAPTTKASVDNIGGWIDDMDNDKFIYVWALNHNVPEDQYPHEDIKNVPAKLATEPITTLTGSLVLKDPGDNEVVDEDDPPFYYGVDDKDIYDFYAYYLGYSINEDTNTEAKYENGVITVSDVKVTGDNDIMIAETDKAADAVVVDEDGNSTMVNPKYLYSQYSARHYVVPNLVFNHMLSKFSFNVRYAGNLAEGSYIELTGITFDGVIKSGELVLNGDGSGLIAGEVDEEDDKIAITSGLPIELNAKTEEEPYGYKPAGNLMVIPAGTGSYNLIIEFKQTFNPGESSTEQTFDLNKEIKLKDVVVDDAGTTATSFDAGKHYVVNITVYGLEEVKVDVQLTEWENAGTVTIDPDQKEDGFMKQVNATLTNGEEVKNCTLYAEAFEPEKDIYCVFTGDGEDGKLVPAPVGTYTVTGAEGDLVEETTITVEVEGKIANVVTPGPETQEVE